MKQVEFNTISSSFGALGTKVTELHRSVAGSLLVLSYAIAQRAKMMNRYLIKAGVYPSIPELSLDNLPINDALAGLSAGLAAGHKAYGNPVCVYLSSSSKRIR